ncbi:MAG: tRNA dihydrouridine synthase DusB [Flavobacteriales bacterium]|nr:tRNA dihydrouridine synthase DusB [Flavobacteriales bacterium]
MKIKDLDLGEYPVILAPMEDITDPPFRTLCHQYGADMSYSEFISADGLIRNAEKSLVKLDIEENERPVGIQIFGANEQSMAQAAQMIASLDRKPDVLDINFGCPVGKVAGKGAGSGIFQDIPNMMRITRAVVNNAGNIPVTVKTRLGWDEHSIVIADIAEELQDCGIQALTIHGRTRCQMYKGEAHWEVIRDIKQNPRIVIPIVGNGDVRCGEDAMRMRDEYGLDGCMIGRATVGSPWIFSDIKHFLRTKEHLPAPDIAERVSAARTHLARAVAWKGERLGVLETRKHYAAYFKGVENFKDTRIRLCTADTSGEVFDILTEVENNF